jgi:hypothetical protein
MQRSAWLYASAPRWHCPRWYSTSILRRGLKLALPIVMSRPQLCKSPGTSVLTWSQVMLQWRHDSKFQA